MTKITLHKLVTCTSRKIQTGIVMLFLLAAAGTSVAQTPFSCADQVSYLTRTGNARNDTYLYQVDLMRPQDHNFILIADPLIVPISSNKVNGIGYNVLDNFIWGSATGTSSIVKIGSDGIVQSFAVPGLPAASYTAGDVDQAGNLYLYVSGATVMYKINVTTLALTTITLSAGSLLGDISVNATGTKIFGMTNAGDLATYTVSGTSATLATVDVGTTTVAPWNTFLDSRGYLYGHYGPFGTTYVLNPLSAKPQLEQVGPGTAPGYPSLSTTNGDGARCPTSEIRSQVPVSCADGVFTLNDIGQLPDCGSPGAVYVYQLNLQTKVQTEIGALVTAGVGPGHLGAMGYNPKDSYLWAARLGTNQMARIGGDGSVKYYPLESFITTDGCGPSLIAADIDKDGIMYAITTRPLNTLIRIDLDPASPTFLTILSSVTMTNVPNGGSIGDFAFNPKDHFLYGVSDGQHVYRINPTTGVCTDLGSTGIPNNIGFPTVTDVFDAAGNLYFQLSNSAGLFKVKNTHLGNSAAFLFKNNINPTIHGDGASCGGLLAGVTISGNVWDDANGDLAKAGGELNTVTDDPSQSLTVYITDADGFIVAKTPVSSDGTWLIERVPDGTFNVTLSNDPSLAVGNIIAIPATLPGNGLWVSTGINFPAPTGTLAGTNTGSIVVGVTLDITDVNFGVEKKPTADTKTFPLSKTPAGGSIITLNGTWPLSVAPTQLTGADYEDGAYDGVTASGPATSIQIISVPVALQGPSTGGDPELYYNGVLVIAGQTINNYDQNNLTALINGRDYKGLSFTYQTIDAAGVHSETATYSVTWQDPLPVKLISFDATKEQNIARLSWVTSEEINADRFEVEKSADAKAWIKIGSLDAAGESRTRLNYVFEDNMPQGGNNYYRLKMIDHNATYTYSRLVHLVFDDNAVSVISYPNPVIDKLYLTGVKPGMKGDISIISTSGRTVYKATGTSLDGIDVKALPTGLYIVKFTLPNGVRGVNKIVISR
jgi:hypothetical protein